MLPEPIQRTAAAPVSDAIDHYAGLLGKQGWCIIPDATPVETVAALDADVAQAFDETPFCEGGFYGRRTKRFGRLLARSPQAARAAYRRAHAGATAHADPLLLSFTWRHLAGLALRDGELAEARHGFAESLRIREELGYLVGTAPALASLADTESEPEATRLREEARRLFRLLGGVPTWLAEQLAPLPPAATA